MKTVFQQILQLFRGSNPLREILEKFAAMLDDGRWMYHQILEIYAGTQRPEEVETELFERDRQINSEERDIRRRLVEYLTITEKPDVAACLILMSVGKDAERVGDYVKNLFDICVHLNGARVPGSELDVSVHQILSRVLPLFDATRGAFLSSDRTMAKHALQTALGLARESEQMVWKIAERNDLTVKAAVLHTLTARHVKRICSHLGNISTAVLQPVDWLDYSDEPTRWRKPPEPEPE
jgi:phosphate transport system protein